MSFWLTTELAILREHYGTGGSSKVRELLPHRSLSSIRAKAAAERVQGIRNTTLGRSLARIYPNREDIDAAIREGYLRATEKGAIKALAARIDRPAWWVQKRAAQLGVTRTNGTRVDAWSSEEIAIVDQWAVASMQTIVRKLSEAGFNRTHAAVAIIMKRRQIDRTDPDVWSATQLAPLFGRDPKTIADWVERRGLRAKRTTWGPQGKLLIHRRDLRRWIATNQHLIDLRRVDQPWFWEVVFGAAAKEWMVAA